MDKASWLAPALPVAEQGNGAPKLQGCQRTLHGEESECTTAASAEAYLRVLRATADPKLRMATRQRYLKQSS